EPSIGAGGCVKGPLAIACAGVVLAAAALRLTAPGAPPFDAVRAVHGPSEARLLHRHAALLDGAGSTAPPGRASSPATARSSTCGVARPPAAVSSGRRSPRSRRACALPSSP